MECKRLDSLVYKRVVVGFSCRVYFFLIFSITVYAGPVCAGKWFVTPSLSIRETFSDNINLAPSGAEQSAFVTEINPGINLQRLGGKTQVNLLYQMQNVVNRGGAGGVNVNHQLQAGASTVVEPNRLFVNASSSISQQNVVNTGVVTTGNLTDSANRADVYTFGVNPTWTPHFNGYADGFVRLGYDFLGTSATAVPGSTPGSTVAFSDQNTFQGSAGLTSGYRFNRVTWRLGYNDTYSLRSVGGDVRFRDYVGEVRYNFNRKYSVFVLGGYTDNSLPGVDTSNGEFYSLGVAWTPSQRFGLEGGYGRNLYFVTLNWVPTLRTNVNVGFRHSDVGTNTGNVWNAQITHRSARVVWNASYSEDTTTVQDILASQSIFGTGTSGSLSSSSVVTQPFVSSVGLPTFTNSILIQRRGEISISGGTAKSSLGLTFFNSRREDLTNPGNDDNSTGVSGFWTWRFIPRTSSNLLVSWNRNSTNSSVVNQRANFYVVSLGLTRNIADYFNIAKGIFGSINYRYSRQNSSDSAFSYRENSVAATLTVNF